MSGNIADMPTILGVDTSLTGTGLCLIEVAPGSAKDDLAGVLRRWSGQCVTVKAPKPTADKSKRAMARRVNALIAQIRDVFAEDKPDLVSMEALAWGARGEGVWVLPWIWGEVIKLCEEFDVPLIIPATSQVKKYATGKGNAPKDAVVPAVLKRWPELDPANNNEGDAATAGAIGCHYLGFPLTEPTTFQADVIAAMDT